MDAFTYYTLSFFVGAVAALPLLAFAQRFRFESKVKLMGRSLIIAAFIYVAFALMNGDMEWVPVELFGVAVYGIFYWLAKRVSLYWLAFGWALHPLWDAGLHLFGEGFGIAPPWYATACISFDLVVAAYCLLLAMREEAELATA